MKNHEHDTQRANSSLYKERDLPAAIITLIFPSVFAMCYFVLFTEHPASPIFYWISRTFLIAFPLVWTMTAEKKPFPMPRMKCEGLFVGFAAGLCIGTVAFLLYTFVLKDFLNMNEIKVKAEQLGFAGDNFLVFAVFLTIANSSVEEYYWRWFNFSKLRNAFPLSWATILSGLGFALHHIIVLIVYFGLGYGLLFGFGVFLGGIFFIFLYHTYDSIWSPWICHAGIDAALMVIGYEILL
ncbi:MAG: CPBP family intramembrane glutamic endopeptidase [Thermodesulfobacteriota bacterium]|nr:CPBP family intramembrane glutamic endopeptidase [Thermodesulfobacteriota bacterium]